MEEWVLAVGDIIVGMDIGTSKVSLVIGEVNSFNQVETLYTGTQKCSGIKKGKIISEEEIMLSISKLVKDAETDKVVYSSTELNVNDCTVDLAGENPGKYTIDIYIGENIFSGSFFIEEESNYQI